MESLAEGSVVYPWDISQNREHIHYVLSPKEITEEHYGDIRYVVHKEEKITLEEYETILSALREASYREILDEILNDKIVCKHYWWVFESDCMCDPNWYYRGHPDLLYL